MFENLEAIGNVIVNLDYWECGCAGNHIHPASFETCPVCGDKREDCPNARAEEVAVMIARGEFETATAEYETAKRCSLGYIDVAERWQAMNRARRAYRNAELALGFCK